MALDHIPSFLDTAGVRHDSAVMRIANYQATGGESGVGGPSHLKVTAQATPNGTVRAAPGTFAAVSRYPNSVGESYIGRNISSTDVTVNPTTASGSRADAVILRIDDVGKVGQAPPAAELQDYQYARLQVVQGVPATLRYPSDLSLNYPFVLLARINIPASTGTITNAMITDLREVVNPKQDTVIRTYHLTDGQQTHVTSTAAFPAGQPFPQTATYPASLRTVRVPEWATQMEVRAEWLSVACIAGSTQGQVWCNWGLTDGVNDHRIQPSRWSADGDTSGRQHWIAMDTVPVGAALRGRDIIFSPRARRYFTPTQQSLMDAYSAFVLTVRFMEAAD